MGQLGQSPERGQSGEFLNPASTTGRRVNFVSLSDTANGRITLQASGDASLQDFGYFAVDLNITVGSAKLDDNSVFANNNMQFFIDGASSSVLDLGDLYRVGTNASTRARMSINIFPHYMFGLINVNDTWARRTYWLCQNNDSGSHTIDGLSQWQFIITGATYRLVG